MVKARQTFDKDARVKLYQQMQQIAYDEVPQLTVAHSVVFEPTRSNVVGYKISPLGRHEFYQVDLK